MRRGLLSLVVSWAVRLEYAWTGKTRTAARAADLGTVRVDRQDKTRRTRSGLGKPARREASKRTLDRQDTRSQRYASHQPPRRFQMRQNQLP